MEQVNPNLDGPRLITLSNELFSEISEITGWTFSPLQEAAMGPNLDRVPTEFYARQK